jgi:hypothetical protein
MENDAGVRIPGNRFLRTRQSAGSVFAMVAVILHEERCPLQNLHHSRTYRESMFLLARNLAGVASATIILAEY